MSAHESIIQQRTDIALAAIKAVYGNPEDDYGATGFIEHHLATLATSYWQAHLQTDSPTPQQVITILVLQSHWGDDDDDGVDVFDFTLPDDITNYVISVRFDTKGKVESIDMES